jgi:prevent-host-death family protein
MGRAYSTYEAKAKLSEIIRRVREGQTVTITYHGRPVAEVRPVPPERQGLDDRIRQLEERGVIVGGSGRPPKRLRAMARRPGALKRFLEERD